MSCLVLDAMGVIFKSADDVAELLIPFIAEKSGSTDEEVIQSAYLEASLGKINPDEFWNQVDVASEYEDEFLSRHSLNPGITELLSQAKGNSISVWCLSNDVGRWSDKLRKKNVIASRKVGIETVMFDLEIGFTDAKNWISRRAL